MLSRPCCWQTLLRLVVFYKVMRFRVTTTTAHTSGFTLSVWDYHGPLEVSIGTALIVDKLYHFVDFNIL